MSAPSSMPLTNEILIKFGEVFQQNCLVTDTQIAVISFENVK
jgi:hypothetical protein